MNMSINELKDQLMSLPQDERALLAQHLWDSLEDFVNPEIEQAWFEEAEKRWHDIEEGRVKCIQAEFVMKKARKTLEKCS